jgi:hypothetical protein
MPAYRFSSHGTERAELHSEISLGLHPSIRSSWLKKLTLPMAVLNPRSHTIGIRLSGEEYSTLERFSVATGARSVSDVARTAILRFLRRPVHESSLASALKYATEVKDLEHLVSQLIAEIGLLKAGRILNESERSDKCTESRSSARPRGLPLASGDFSADDDLFAKKGTTE